MQYEKAMSNKRRDFLKFTGLTGLSIASGGFTKGIASEIPIPNSHNLTNVSNANFDQQQLSIIGLYGPWASSLTEGELPLLSYRKKEFPNLDIWKRTANVRVYERLSMPIIRGIPKVNVNKQHTYDGLHIEELSWQLPYGRPTEAILLKPLNQTKPLPGILAFHDHGGNKYFGARKITRTSDEQHPLMKDHQKEYYEGLAWANEIAKRGFVVLVPDAFTFASRRVMMQDIPADRRQGLNDDDPENPKNIEAYNKWAGEHEHVMAKSLFCAGTTWPGVFFAEDQKALDILCARTDVDPKRIGCGGLSGGGLRTVMSGGLDPRIKCAVCVGFMSTWKDFLLNKSYTHTWMLYIPMLPKELDFPEILGLRTPLPTLVLNDEDDELYTLPEMKRADKILSEVYQKANAADHYKCSFYPGPHKFDAKMQAEAFEWFEKWLGI
jgi:dienelactone hydrolase